jgi:histidinol-phosphate aminotransferase
VILPVPTFFIYNHFLAYKKVRIIETPYILKKEHFAFPTKDILLAIKKGVQGVVICNPGNPIGVSASKHDLLAILRETHKKNIPFIVDEAYFEYCGFSLVPFIRTFPNLIVLRTFSKAYGLAGMRVGYVVASTRVIDALTKIRLPWNVNHLAIEAARIVLEERAYILKQVREQKKTLLRIAGLLRKKGLVVHTTETNFVLARFPNATKTTATLAKHSLLVKNLSGYPAEHGLLQNMVRISVPAKKDLKTVVSLFSQYL